MNDDIRVRYAPSPTGYVHIGNLRTALYNYLFARKNKGKFILRIEDTDQSRKIEGALENIIDMLKWAGLDYDEGPLMGGEYGPYHQSERMELYKKHAEILIKNKNAYYCFCTQERLKKLREEQTRQKLPQTKYDKHCLNLTLHEIEHNLSTGIQYVIRLNVNPEIKVRFSDYIRGNLEFEGELIDDQVLIKSDGYPTYHLANVIDDHYMKISHIIRGEEWLPSTPKHVLLYDAFGWDLPVFAHLPLLLNPDRSKLSKRQGDVAVEDYKNKGYLSEALVNFIALLGWTAGDDKEYYSLDQLIDSFSLDRVNKSGAVFDIEKLNWLNAEHLRNKSDGDIIMLLRDELKKSKYSMINLSDEYLTQVIKVMRDRISFVKDILVKGYYFFEDPGNYEETSVKKSWNSKSAEYLKKYAENLSTVYSPEKSDYESVLKDTARDLNIGTGNIIHPLRIALSGTSGGPGIFDIMNILGKETTLKRISLVIIKLGI